MKTTTSILSDPGRPGGANNPLPRRVLPARFFAGRWYHELPEFQIDLIAKNKKNGRSTTHLRFEQSEGEKQ